MILSYKCVFFFLFMLISQKKPEETWEMHAVCSQQYERKRLPRAATYCPTPCCEELTPSAGPECTSNRGPKIIGMGADLSLNHSTSSILTRDFIVLSRKRITPDSALTGMRELCVCSQESVKNDAVKAQSSKCQLVSFADSLRGITKSALMNR